MVCSSGEGRTGERVPRSEEDDSGPEPDTYTEQVGTTNSGSSRSVTRSGRGNFKRRDERNRRRTLDEFSQGNPNLNSHRNGDHLHTRSRSLDWIPVVK